MSIMRRILIVPAALVLALALGYSLLWVYAAHRLEDGFIAWTQVQASRGHSFEHGPLSLSGFPGPIRLAIDAPRYASQKSEWRWSAERADLEMRPWDWWTYRLDLPGQQSVTLPLNGAVEELSARAVQRPTRCGNTAGAATQRAGNRGCRGPPRTAGRRCEPSARWTVHAPG